MKLFFPTSSLNFNDIFATESISPKSFYSERVFGTSRHFITNRVLGPNQILLFSSIPLFTLMNGDSYDEVPMVLEVDIDTTKYSVQKISDNVFSYNETIYFNNNTLRVLFYSSEDLNKILVKSQLVSETKGITKYKDVFTVIDASKINHSHLDLLDFGPVSLNRIGLDKDRLFNHAKGFFISLFAHFYSNELTHITQRMNQVSLVLNNLQKFTGNINPENESLRIFTEFLKVSQPYGHTVVDYYQNKLQEIENLFSTVTFNNGILKCEKLLNDSVENKAIEVIINSLISSREDVDKEITKENIIKLIIKLGVMFRNEFGDSSVYHKDAISIYNRIANRNYDFTIDNLSSIVMKNLFAFLLKYNNQEELEKVLLSYKVEKSFLAHSFFGCYIGYANLNREVTHDLYKSDDKYVIKLNETNIEKLRLQIWSHFESLSKLDNNKTDREQKGLQQNMFSILKETGFNAKELVGEIIAEINRLRKAQITNDLINLKKIKLSDQTEVVIQEKADKNVLFTFSNSNLSNNINVLLERTENTSDIEKKEFKEWILSNTVKKFSSRGKYPTFKYYKKTMCDLSSTEEKSLHNWLTQLY